jgi:hypothetical protein
MSSDKGCFSKVTIFLKSLVKDFRSVNINTDQYRICIVIWVYPWDFASRFGDHAQIQ